MRILFTAYAARPHFYPMAPLAWACLNAGHEVRFASTPSLMDTVNESGLPGVSVGEDIDADSWYRRGTFVPKPADPDEPEINAWMRVTDQLAEKQFSVCEHMVDGLVDYCRKWRPDLIVHDPVTFAGPVAGAVLGLPTVSHLYGLARLLRLDIKDWVGTEHRQGYLDLFDRWGVEPLLDPDAWIDPCPPGLRWPGQHEINRVQMRYIPYNGPGVAPSWLLEPPSRPRVVVTWGTSQQKKLGVGIIELFGRIARSAASLDVEVVLTVGAMDPEHRGHLGELPDNVRAVDWLPLSALVQSSQAIVHTGGTGVMMTSAAYGVPQLGITKIPEGRFNVERLVAVGAGRHLPQDEVDAPSVRDHLSALLEDASHRDAAGALRQEIEEQPLPASVVPALEEIVAKAEAAK
ncbi:nucleotide disphospho-sugar-binding domain-containing protein [Streptomyces rishiriensis]|uniref:nucleotide disphospho-sugar-binding domain-containing protein n=1 Tax=Streptomyces rishiriensis TaxID=68264 RepID=UPI000D5936CA|nr:nucleotide disphospho-sugar-binding domain-containing protein [Streptomyces rishiriensis]